MEKEKKLVNEEILSLANTLRWDLGMDFHDTIIESIYEDASRIAGITVRQKGEKEVYSREQKIDKIVTSRLLGFPLMFLLLAAVFWVTVSGANYPSGLLASFLIDFLHPVLKNAAASSTKILKFICSSGGRAAALSAMPRLSYRTLA